MSENAELDARTLNDGPCHATNASACRGPSTGELAIMSRDYLVASSVVVGFAMLSLAIYFGLAHRDAKTSRAANVSVNAIKAAEPSPSTRPSASTLAR